MRALRPRRHSVYELAPGLLLVFKPEGHREAPHAHPYRQRLRVLRGRLLVRVGARAVTLTPASRAFSLPAARLHETRAVQATWLLAERMPRR